MADIELARVTKRFDQLVAVDAVDLAVEAGEVVCLLGPSGCGKTTTLRMIAGLELPSEGRILIAGRDVTNLSATQRDVSMVFQSYALFPHMSVLENVCYGLRRSGLGKAEAAARAHDGLKQVGLAGFEARQPSELSGGQQQRVAVARALVGEPALLLADEPTGNLDSTSTHEILGLFDELHAQGRTLVLITHEADVAARAERVVRVMDGRITTDGGAP